MIQTIPDSVPQLKGERSHPHSMTTGGFLETTLDRSNLAAVARLAQVNSEGRMQDAERLEILARLERIYDEGRLSGCVVLTPQQTIAACGCLERMIRYDGWLDFEMQGIHVHPNLRRQGLGKVVVESLVEMAKGEGARQVDLHVLNPIAVRLYEQFGFTDSGFRSMHDGAMEMWLKLEQPRQADAHKGPLSINLANQPFFESTGWDAAL